MSRDRATDFHIGIAEQLKATICEALDGFREIAVRGPSDCHSACLELEVLAEELKHASNLCQQTIAGLKSEPSLHWSEQWKESANQ